MSSLPVYLAYFTSGQDWLIVAGVVLVLFGGTKIPELARGVGEGIREFKKSIDGVHDTPSEKTSETKTVEEK